MASTAELSRDLSCIDLEYNHTELGAENNTDIEDPNEKAFLENRKENTKNNPVTSSSTKELLAPKQYETEEMKPIIPTEKLKKIKVDTIEYAQPSTSIRERLAQKRSELEELRTSSATREELYWLDKKIDNVKQKLVKPSTSTRELLAQKRDLY